VCVLWFVSLLGRSRRCVRARRHEIVDGHADHPPDRAVFAGSKASWFEIADDLPQFDEYAS
jgi:hypothetical protein